MTVTHNGKQYTVRRMANGYSWRFSEVDNRKSGFTTNGFWLLANGFRHVLEAKQ